MAATAKDKTSESAGIARSAKASSYLSTSSNSRGRPVEMSVASVLTRIGGPCFPHARAALSRLGTAAFRRMLALSVGAVNVGQTAVAHRPAILRTRVVRASRWLTLMGLLCWPHLAAAQEARPDTPSVAPQGLLIQERRMVLTVDDPVVAAEALRKLAGALGGQPGQESGGVVKIRIPPTRLDQAFKKLEELGELDKGNAKTVDVTMKAADIGARIEAARRTHQRLAALRSDASVKDALLIERRLRDVDEQIARMRAVVADLERSTTFIVLKIRLVRRHEVRKLPKVELPFDWLGKISLENLLRPSVKPRRHGGRDSFESNGDISVQLEGLWLADRPDPSDASVAGAFGMHVRGGDTDPVGAAAGFDLSLGGGEGFVYEVGMMGGIGTAIGRVASIGLVGGLGTSGWTGSRRIPVAFELAAELFVMLDVGEEFRLFAFARPRWTPTTNRRQNGSEHALLGDEAVWGGAILVPWLIDEDELDDGGLRFGFTYREQVRTEVFLFTLGVGWGLQR